MNDSNFEELTADELVGVGGGRGCRNHRCRPRPCNDMMDNQAPQTQMPSPTTTPAPPPVTITITMNPAGPAIT